MVDAETLAAWNRDSGPALSTAERAAADRSWAYGHVLDQAQELSAMAWRMVLRRNLVWSMTVVGDSAHRLPGGAGHGRRCSTRRREAAGGGAADGQLPHPGGDHGRRDRRPRRDCPGRAPAGLVRSEGVGPRAIRVPPATAVTATCIAEVTRADLAEIGGPDGGRLAVIVPDSLAAELAAAIPEAIPGDQPESLDSAAALLTVTQAKGLEFDRVVLADPAGVIAQSPNGGHDLYVAITRATHRLTVVYEGELPAPLRSLTQTN